MGAADRPAPCGQAAGGPDVLPARAPAGLTVRPLEERDLAGAAAIEAAAPDAWSESALRAGLCEQQAGGAARLFAAELCGAKAPAEEAAAETAGSKAALAGALAGPTLAGVAAFQLAAEEAGLDTLTVAPNFRRQGIGRALLGAALAQLRAEGAAACFLEVRASNAPAIALYRSLGFAAVGRRRGFYRAPAEDAIVMRCDLADAPE